MPTRNMEELPLVLHASHIRTILGLSRGKVYELMHRSDFPTIFIGKRMVVSKDDFFDWLADGKLKIKRRAIIC